MPDWLTPELLAVDPALNLALNLALSIAWLRWVVAGLFALVGLCCLILVVVGLPGLWVMLALAGGVQFIDRWWLPPEAPRTFSMWTLIGVAALALGSEVLEFAAGAAGAKRGGASQRGMVGALIGGIVGAIVGAPFGLVIGAVAGGVVGSAAGAIVGELTHSHMTLEKSLGPASGAAAGRLAGLIGKLVCTLIAWVVLTVAACVQ